MIYITLFQVTQPESRNFCWPFILYSPQFRSHQETKMATRRTQRSTSTISRKTGDSEQSRHCRSHVRCLILLQFCIKIVGRPDIVVSQETGGVGSAIAEAQPNSRVRKAWDLTLSGSDIVASYKTWGLTLSGPGRSKSVESDIVGV